MYLAWRIELHNRLLLQVHQCLSSILLLSTQGGPVVPSLGVGPSTMGHMINLKGREMIKGRGKRKLQNSVVIFGTFL